MKVYFTILLLLTFSDDLLSQNMMKQFFRLSCPEKIWVITHPCVAKKARQIANTAKKYSHRPDIQLQLDNRESGGRQDAFRHAFWMALLAREIGVKKGIKLGKAHEKGNFRQFKKAIPEEGEMPDYAASEMDLFNNKIGAELGKLNSKVPADSMAKIVIDAVNKGDLRIIKTNKNGKYVSCENTDIEYPGKHKVWFTGRCLVPSNYKPE